MGQHRPSFCFFESVVHVRSLQIYEYFMVTLNSTIFIMMHHAVSHKMIFFYSFTRVIWLLTQCFKLISFYILFVFFSNFRIYPILLKHETTSSTGILGN